MLERLKRAAERLSQKIPIPNLYVLGPIVLRLFFSIALHTIVRCRDIQGQGVCRQGWLQLAPMDGLCALCFVWQGAWFVELPEIVVNR